MVQGCVHEQGRVAGMARLGGPKLDWNITLPGFVIVRSWYGCLVYRLGNVDAEPITIFTSSYRRCLDVGATHVVLVPQKGAAVGYLLL